MASGVSLCECDKEKYKSGRERMWSEVKEKRGQAVVGGAQRQMSDYACCVFV